MGSGYALKRQLRSTAKHGTRVSAKALTLVDRKAWDQSKR
ncbi:hypothetical protein Y024_5415 [Burkholderia pseudomallei TSV44]|nr:hypothetical protein Y024_5415 [Burkholderia pseudomallei TSV44]